MIQPTTLRLAPYCQSAAQIGPLDMPGVYPIYIGRDAGLDVRVIHPTVSQVHAEVFSAGGRLWIRDLSSRNGTFVNGNRIQDAHPLALWDIVQFGSVVFRVAESEDGTAQATQQSAADDMALAVSQFEKLLVDGGLVPYYQPIVAARGEAVAYEVLARSGRFGLRTPKELFRTAAVLCRTGELSHLCRLEGVKRTPGDLSPHLFLNTSPLEVCELDALIASVDEIRALRPSQPLTLEVHESALVEVDTLVTLCKRLAERKISLAFDDFGTGESRLAELVDARPKFVKFDRRLCALDQLGSRDGRRLLAALLRMVHDLGIVSIAEGIETPQSADICRSLGFQLLQGFYFGVPAKGSEWFKRQAIVSETLPPAAGLSSPVADASPSADANPA
ncbi:MAG TPA: EAL domain-containing protein [Pirellulaceae bacterium]|nr:EAL domain-containing protein [Pirellulaceae bacterium]